MGGRAWVAGATNKELRDSDGRKMVSAPGPEDCVSENSGLFRRGSSGRGKREIPPFDTSQEWYFFPGLINPKSSISNHEDLNPLALSARLMDSWWLPPATMSSIQDMSTLNKSVLNRIQTFLQTIFLLVAQGINK
jgi:hypothetical protein